MKQSVGLFLVALFLAAGPLRIQAAEKPGEVLLDNLNKIFETMSQGALPPGEAASSLDTLKAAAIQALDKKELTPAFFDRYIRVLRIVRLVMATGPNDPEAANAEKEIGLFVKDVSGKEWNAEAPVSKKIGRFSEAVAAESAALRLTLTAPPGPGAAPGDEAVRAGNEIKPPQLIREVKPVYPQIALSARVQGIVIVEVRTDIRGDVKDIKVIKSIPLLDQAAIDAVKQWKYEPCFVDGKPREIIFTAVVTFSLN